MRSSAAGNLLGIGEVFDAYAYCKDLSNLLQYKEPKKQHKSHPRRRKRHKSQCHLLLTLIIMAVLTMQGLATSQCYEASSAKLPKTAFRPAVDSAHTSDRIDAVAGNENFVIYGGGT